MARVKIDLNSSGMKALLKSGGVRAELLAVAERVAARARDGAPVRSGVYKASIKVVPDVTDRAVVRVVTTASHGLLVEARTGNLKRALGG